MDEIIKKKISDAQLGPKNHMYGKKGILCPNFGRYPTKETRLKMAISGKNKVFTKEHRKNLGLAHKGNKNYWYGTKGSMFGRNHSIKTKQLLSELNKQSGNPMYGKHQTNKAKEKISLATKGKNNPMFGHTHSEKTKEKIRSARLIQIFPRKDSKLEIVVQTELKKRNIKFKKHVPLIGQPDIFIEPNICIFCDGDYWHANPDKYKFNDIISRQHNKTAENIWKKDSDIVRKLTEMNYFVLRFWETDIYKNINLIGNRIETILR